MKSKIQRQQENNFKRVSKTTFFHLGILIAMISNSAFAKELTNEQNYHESNSSKIELVSESNAITLRKPVLVLEFDTIVTKTANYKKTIEEIITEDNKIIESEIENNTISAIERKNEKVINEDNQIIESNVTNEAFPLDFFTLNKATPKIKKVRLQNTFLNKNSMKL